MKTYHIILPDNTSFTCECGKDHQIMKSIQVNKETSDAYGVLIEAQLRITEELEMFEMVLREEAFAKERKISVPWDVSRWRK